MLFKRRMELCEYSSFKANREAEHDMHTGWMSNIHNEHHARRDACHVAFFLVWAHHAVVKRPRAASEPGKISNKNIARFLFLLLKSGHAQTPRYKDTNTDTRTHRHMHTHIYKHTHTHTHTSPPPPPPTPHPLLFALAIGLSRRRGWRSRCGRRH